MNGLRAPVVEPVDIVLLHVLGVQVKRDQEESSDQDLDVSGDQRLKMDVLTLFTVLVSCILDKCADTVLCCHLFVQLKPTRNVQVPQNSCWSAW